MDFWGATLGISICLISLTMPGLFMSYQRRYFHNHTGRDGVWISRLKSKLGYSVMEFKRENTELTAD